MFRRHGSFCLNTTNGEPAGAVPPAAPAAPAPVVPAVLAVPPVAPTAPAAPATPPAPASSPADPTWLPDRLARAGDAALKAAGFASAEEAKAAKAALDATKTEAQRQAEKIAELTEARRILLAG